MNKPSIFISSSTEGLGIARALSSLLEEDSIVSTWADGFFELGKSSLETIIGALDRFDFAVFIITADDEVINRDKQRLSSRENLLFELGLFIGRLGRSRTFLVMSDEVKMQFPSDLAGLTQFRYKIRSDGNIHAALGPAASILRREIAVFGSSSRRPIEYYSCFISFHQTDQTFVENIYADLRDVGVRSWLAPGGIQLGGDFPDQIDQTIKKHDKVLIILSKASLNSPWVQLEIEQALKLEHERRQTVLFLISLDNELVDFNKQSFSKLASSKYIFNFSDWEDPSMYKRAFSRLIKELTISISVES